MKKNLEMDRLQAIIDRWDKDKYTADSLPMRGLLAELQQFIREETEDECE